MQPANEKSNGFFPIPDCLQLDAPVLTVSKRRLKQLDTIQLIREQRENRQQPLAFDTRPFVLCGLPLRRPPKSQLVHARHSGQFFLHVTAHPDFGLPYGQDRLIPIWVATLALQQKDLTIHFDSASQILDFFRLPKDGPHYQRLIAGFQRTFAATIFFGTEETPSGARLIDFSRFHFFDRMRLWSNSDPAGQSAHSVSHDNIVTLSEAFQQEIDQNPIPVEREAIACLAHAPGTLDFYIWLVWKTWTVNRASVRIPLFGPHGLSQQLGTAKYSNGRFFRRKLQHWLRQVKVVWPDCPAAISNDGQVLVIRSSKTSPAIRTANIPKGGVAPSPLQSLRPP